MHKGTLTYAGDASGKMSEGRSFLGSAAVDGRVFMIGGCLNEDYSTTEVWDPDTGTFQYIAKEPTSHIHCPVQPKSSFKYDRSSSSSHQAGWMLDVISQLVLRVWVRGTPRDRLS